MDDTALFAAIERNRHRFADLVDTLDDTQLATPSLCAAWTVRDVAGHLVIASAPPMVRFATAMARAFGNYDKAMDRMSREEARRPVAELTAAIRANATSRFAPPMVGPRGPLTDVLVHTVDIAHPLDLPYEADPDDVHACLDFVTDGWAAAFVPTGQLAGLRFEATDVPFTWGDGAVVTGKGLDLVALACGRAAVLDRLDGPGVELLRER